MKEICKRSFHQRKILRAVNFFAKVSHSSPVAAFQLSISYPISLIGGDLLGRRHAG
jgi:hypothetical protein